MKNWRSYTFEFLSIFIAVISAFALNSWNDNRRENLAEQKILLEIRKGLPKDINDLNINVNGHLQGIIACHYWRDLIENKPRSKDSLQFRFIQLTRDFTSLQNSSGYETLKSRGLELIDNDSLRTELISLYEYDYYTLRKLEEGYEEMQFHKNYFNQINTILAPYFRFNAKGEIADLVQPIRLSQQDKNALLSLLIKIEWNRRFILRFYGAVEKNVYALENSIDKELDNND